MIIVNDNSDEDDDDDDDNSTDNDSDNNNNHHNDNNDGDTMVMMITKATSLVTFRRGERWRFISRKNKGVRDWHFNRYRIEQWA